MNPLENDFNVFQYVNQFYFPRPDHKNKGDVVSIAWAATRSENIASIWLLDHLLDRLSQEQFDAVAAENGYAQLPDEDSKAYFARLRDKFGLTMKEDVKREIEFTKAQYRLAALYESEDKFDKAMDVRNLRYGTYNDVAMKQAKKDEKIKAFIAHNYKNYSEILRAREMQELDPDVSEKLPPLDSVKLFRNFTLADMKRLSAMIDPVNSEIDYLLPDNIRYWPDFRRSLSMAEYARFAHEIGIHQKLQKVFSMPRARTANGTNRASSRKSATGTDTSSSGTRWSRRSYSTRTSLRRWARCCVRCSRTVRPEARILPSRW